MISYSAFEIFDLAYERKFAQSRQKISRSFGYDRRGFSWVYVTVRLEERHVLRFCEELGVATCHVLNANISCTLIKTEHHRSPNTMLTEHLLVFIGERSEPLSCHVN